MIREMALTRLRATAAVLHSQAFVRVAMAASWPRVAPRKGRAAGSLARAMRTTALGQVPPEERRWTERIEARRHELHLRDASAQPFEAALPETVSGASHWVSIPPTWTPFLTRLVRELEPQSCVELGTGLGISTAYQAAALQLNNSGFLTTIDGSPEWASVAREGLESLGLDRVEVCVGAISETLPGVLERVGPVDYALVDAEHTEEATMGYFEGLLPHLASEAVVVFDDVPWTRELRRTWRRVARHERVSAALALGRIGVAVIS